MGHFRTAVGATTPPINQTVRDYGHNQSEQGRDPFIYASIQFPIWIVESLKITCTFEIIWSPKGFSCFGDGYIWLIQ